VISILARSYYFYGAHHRFNSNQKQHPLTIVNEAKDPILPAKKMVDFNVKAIKKT
jgi:hypothetical protein